MREQAGREASPTTAIIDSQTAKGAQKGGSTPDPSGYDAGKMVVGRKRHLLTDTIGMLLAVIVHPASVQDCGGAEPLLRQARRLFPLVKRIIGDAGYQGPKMAACAARTGTWKIEIVRHCDRHRFVVLPKRWIVERTIGLEAVFRATETAASRGTSSDTAASLQRSSAWP